MSRYQDTEINESEISHYSKYKVSKDEELEEYVPQLYKDNFDESMINNLENNILIKSDIEKVLENIKNDLT